MATADQIRALLRSYATGDRNRFDAVALQIAAQSARQGQQELADEIRALVDQARAKRDVHPALPLAKPKEELSGLIRASYPKVRLSDMVLPKKVLNELREIVHQQRQREKLIERGLQPRRRILLVGPPGCGKTMTAGAIASECNLPLLLVQLHMLVSRYLGETAVKLNQVFEAMAETRAVYFFDEFDAIGATRQSANDVGEMRRVLNTFLQLVEHDQSDSLLIAATNLDHVLDVALYRRFDCVIRYPLPDVRAIRTLFKNRLAGLAPSNIVTARLVHLAKGLSHAEISHAAEDAAREAVLRGKNEICSADLIAAVKARKSMRIGR